MRWSFWEILAPGESIVIPVFEATNVEIKADKQHNNLVHHSCHFQRFIFSINLRNWKAETIFIMQAV